MAALLTNPVPPASADPTAGLKNAQTHSPVGADNIPDQKRLTAHNIPCMSTEPVNQISTVVAVLNLNDNWVRPVLPRGVKAYLPFGSVSALRNKRLHPHPLYCFLSTDKMTRDQSWAMFPQVCVSSRPNFRQESGGSNYHACRKTETLTLNINCQTLITRGFKLRFDMMVLSVHHWHCGNNMLYVGMLSMCFFHPSRDTRPVWCRYLKAIRS